LEHYICVYSIIHSVEVSLKLLFPCTQCLSVLYAWWFRNRY